MAEVVGRVSTLWRFPVKSLLGDALDTAEVSPLGIPGDRCHVLWDEEINKKVTAVNVKRYPNLFAFKARYARAPESGGPLPELIVSLPNGEEVRASDPGFDEAISAQLGHPVRLLAAPDREGDDRGAPWHDAFPVSVLTTSTLKTMEALQPGSRFDARRFRMNLIVDSPEDGFPENEWIGHTLAVGPSLRLQIDRADARCIMTTLPQEDLPNDPAILAGLARHNRLQVGKGRYPCAGVYARVTAAGRVTAGDEVTLES